MIYVIYNSLVAVICIVLVLLGAIDAEKAGFTRWKMLFVFLGLCTVTVVGLFAVTELFRALDLLVKTRTIF